MQIRRGTSGDFDAVMAMLDEAVDWLVEQGRTDQWGDKRWSERSETAEFIRKMVDGDDLWIAEIDGQPTGALIVSESPMPYTPPVDERELYIKLLVTSRHHKGKGIGKQLIEKARSIARERKIELLRVDCYSGPDEKLVRFYESAGFARSERVNVRGDTYVQIFEDRISLR